MPMPPLKGNDITPQPPASSHLGRILQRGGEELWVEPVADRFTTQLQSSEAFAPLRHHLNPVGVRAVAGGQLIEWQLSPARLEPFLALVRQHPWVKFASHVYRLAESPQTWVYLNDQITVQFAPGTPVDRIEAQLAALGLVVDQRLPGMPVIVIARVTAAARENPIKLANRLVQDSHVRVAEPNVVVETSGLYRPVDDRYPQQWHLGHQGGAGLAPASHIHAEAAWNITRGSRSIVIAISDDGFDLGHPDLQGAGKLVAPIDLQDQDAVPLPLKQNENHGTAVAGLAIGEENGSGIVGVAPGCAFLPIRTTGFIDDVAIERLFLEAMERGADVIACSWSPTANYFPLTLRQQNAITCAATEGRQGKGCVIVFSAGNANRPLNGTVNEKQWPNQALHGPTQWLSGFAIHPDVIAVAASTSLGQKAAYSNWGEQIAIAAPSDNGPPRISLAQVGTVPTGPELHQPLPGLGMVTSDRTHALGYSQDSYTTGFGGTSSACPLVAGVAGLMLSVNPNLTAREVREILQTTVDKIIDRNPDPQLGLRYGTYDGHGHSRWFGYGKVNALRAVQEAQRRAFAGRQVRQIVKADNTTTLTIPDGEESGIESVISVSQTGTVQDLYIRVAIDHEFLGDLSLTLLAPSGYSLMFQSRTLGNQITLRQTYTLQTTPTLMAMIGQPAQGNWRLRIVDHVPSATGRLLSWGVTLGLG
jgi:subtilisin family serine protease